MHQLSQFTNPSVSLNPTPDPTVDLVVYLITAAFGYMFFKVSQLARAKSIGGMKSSVVPILAKGVEYSLLAISASFIYDLFDYQGAMYYGLDVVVAGLLIWEAIKGDKIHRGEYQRLYNISKNKLMTRMIMNLIHHPTHSDN